MDPMAQAFAFYNFVGTAVGDGTNTGSLQYTQARPRPSNHINTGNFTASFVTRMTAGATAGAPAQPGTGLGSDIAGSGNGAKFIGLEAGAQRRVFPVPGAEGVPGGVLPGPASQLDLNQVSGMTSAFKAGGYKYKPRFASAAVYCMGS